MDIRHKMHSEVILINFYNIVRKKKGVKSLDLWSTRIPRNLLGTPLGRNNISLALKIHTVKAEKGRKKLGKKSRSKAKSNPEIAFQDKKPNPELENFTQAMRLASASALPMAMQAAIDLGVFDMLAPLCSGLRSVDIAARLGCRHPDSLKMLDRLIAVLCCHNVLACSEGCYSLTPAAKYFAKNEDGVSLAPLLRLNHDRVFLESWSGVKDAILEGGNPFSRAHGMHCFEYLGKDGRFNQVYSTAMFNHTTVIVKKILKTFNGFKNVKTLVDVGGGIGVALSLIISMYPSIKGINFDLPHVIQHAPPFPGVKHVAGDMFESVPSGDAILMKGILWDWSDDQCLKLLKNCYNALPKDGKVIVIEQILPTVADLASVHKGKLLNDVLTMTLNPGGKERKQGEMFRLAEESGFDSIGISSFQCHYCVLELIKSPNKLVGSG
ncbi:LOW QUALITY PROTEIN: caffeic acid 3-O-methyltransferase-like [Herrania umbratica]|uniref:LOW QUALITY PROTEIN: caffeic acid 3-O-methyltransferase-like n=1 Tax=Herrania umbratica TaxID=108875 RepID=A0A6J0ZZI2_9ROSI|nr:LOW QUALITY PROTEIN: caffeic acid 3-O-methyltransferase-like [Herrania umbratica]